MNVYGFISTCVREGLHDFPYLCCVPCHSAEKKDESSGANILVTERRGQDELSQPTDSGNVAR